MKQIFIVGIVGFMLASLANGEIVTNAKGESIELKNNGTWVKVKNKGNENSDLVINGNSQTIDVKDGNDKSIPIKVYVKIEAEPDKKLTVSELASRVNLTAFQIKLRLKNKYSFVPKTAMATLNGNNLEIFMEYVAKNSYGAEVVGHDMGRFELNAEGRFAPVYK